MGILKKYLKTSPLPPIQCCEPITYLTQFLLIVSQHCWWGGGETKKNVQMAVCPLIFVTDCLKNS